MKCLCGFTQTPDNVRILKAHLDDCLSTGALKDLYPEPFVVWRGGLRVVKELEQDEVALEMGINIKRAPAQAEKVKRAVLQKEERIHQLVVEKEQEEADPEEIIEAVEEIKAEKGLEESTPAPKAAPKKKAPAKKKSSTTKK